MTVESNGDRDSQTTESKAPGEKTKAQLAMEKAKMYAQQKAKSRAMRYTIYMSARRQ